MRQSLLVSCLLLSALGCERKPPPHEASPQDASTGGGAGERLEGGADASAPPSSRSPALLSLYAKRERAVDRPVLGTWQSRRSTASPELPVVHLAEAACREGTLIQAVVALDDGTLAVHNALLQTRSLSASAQPQRYPELLSDPPRSATFHRQEGRTTLVAPGFTLITTRPAGSTLFAAEKLAQAGCFHTGQFLARDDASRSLKGPVIGLYDAVEEIYALHLELGAARSLTLMVRLPARRYENGQTLSYDLADLPRHLPEVVVVARAPSSEPTPETPWQVERVRRGTLTITTLATVARPELAFRLEDFTLPDALASTPSSTITGRAAIVTDPRGLLIPHFVSDGADEPEALQHAP